MPGETPPLGAYHRSAAGQVPLSPRLVPVAPRRSQSTTPAGFPLPGICPRSGPRHLTGDQDEVPACTRSAGCRFGSGHRGPAEPGAIGVAQDAVIGMASFAPAGTTAAAACDARFVLRSAFFQTPRESTREGAVTNAPARPVPADQYDVGTCLVCGMTGPSLDSRCLPGWDHRVSPPEATCPGCGRLTDVCVRRFPCQARRSRFAWRLAVAAAQRAGGGCGHGPARRAAACRGGARDDVRARHHRAEHGAGLAPPAGGKDHFAADRPEADAGDALPAAARAGPGEPGVPHRGGRWAARQGIGQFIDLGAGLPASPSVHQAARAVLPAARVAYVDIDPVVLTHAVALLATGDGVAAVDADLRDPAAVLGHQDLRAVIIPGRPVCVILGAVVHFLDPQAACAVTAGYVSLMAPGSCLVLSCARFEDEALAKQLAQEYTAATWHNHSPAGIAEFFDGLELAGPGVTEARTWPSGRLRRMTVTGTCWPAWPRPRQVMTTAHEDCRCRSPGPRRQRHDGQRAERARRHLMGASAGIPGPPVQIPILAHISAIDAELAERARRPAT